MANVFLSENSGPRHCLVFETAWPDVASSSDASFLRGFLTNQLSQFAATVYLEFGRSAAKWHLGELLAMMEVSEGSRGGIPVLIVVRCEKQFCGHDGRRRGI